MKPDVILTGEQLPAPLALRARRLLRECEVILVAGTSFSGGPVMDWVEQAYGHGKKLVIVNSSPPFWTRLQMQQSGRRSPGIFPPDKFNDYLTFVEPEQFPGLTEGLLRKGCDEAVIRGILGENFLRVAKNVWK